MPRNELPSHPSNGSGRQPPDKAVDPVDIPVDIDPADRESSPTSRDSVGDEGLTGDDIMAALDLDDLYQMDGPDA